MKKIVIADYGLGNLKSVETAFLREGVSVLVSAAPTMDADGIVVPGVGAFKEGMVGLEKTGWIKTLKEAATQNVPMLGICLGAQLFLQRGFEFGEHEGLGIIEGTVEILENAPRLPHIGWNQVHHVKEDAFLKEIPNDSYFYFVHSYTLKPKDAESILAVTSFGPTSFASIIKKGSIYGCQFHPEKSAEVGRKLIQNFLALSRK